MRKATTHDLLMVATSALICGVLAITFAIMATLGARADQITIGVWDNAIGGGVQTIASGTDFVHGQYPNGSPPNLGTFGGNFTAVTLAPDASGSVFREFATDNVFATQTDTMRLYASFSGITADSLDITFPTIFQSLEPGAGYTIVEQVFVCGSTLFCDNDIVGGGTLIGSQAFSNTTGTFFPTLSASIDSPFQITEVFHFVADGFDPNANVGGAILTQPDTTRSVPGPIVGAGLPGLIAALGAMLALARRRRAKQ